MTATLELTQASTFKISGDLDADSVNTLLTQGIHAVNACDQPELTIDLSGVGDSSSAGVALLLALWKRTKQRNKTLQLINIPSKMHAIMRVSNLDALLDI